MNCGHQIIASPSTFLEQYDHAVGFILSKEAVSAWKLPVLSAYKTPKFDIRRKERLRTTTKYLSSEETKTGCLLSLEISFRLWLSGFNGRLFLNPNWHASTSYDLRKLSFRSVPLYLNNIIVHGESHVEYSLPEAQMFSLRDYSFPSIRNSSNLNDSYDTDLL